MKWLTVKELIEILSKEDPSLRVICTRDGNGHSYPIVKENIEKTKDCYFPDDGADQPLENETILRIALI